MPRKPLLEETKQKEMNAILEYIRQNTKDTDEWLSISSRTIYNLFNFSQGHFLPLSEAIKEHPNIIYEIDESFPTRFKPYKFRWINDSREKINQELTHKQFFWLTDEEIIYIKNTLQISEFMELSKILKLCNLLAGEKAKEYWITINAKDLADLSVLSVAQVEDKINLLVEKSLLVKSQHVNYYRLVLNPDFLYDIIAESQQENVAVKPKVERKKQKPAESKVDTTTATSEVSSRVQLKKRAKGRESNLLQKLKPARKKNANINPDTIETIELFPGNVSQNDVETNIQSAVDSNADATNLKADAADSNADATDLKTDAADSNADVTYNGDDIVRHIIGNAQTIEHLMSKLAGEFRKYSAFLMRFQEQSRENHKSYEAFMKLLEEYEDFKLRHEQTEKRLQEYEVKVHKFEHEIKSLCRNHEEFLINTQARMDVLLGEISGLIDKFITIPTYKMDEVVAARLKKDVWQSTMKASDEIMKFKPESKFAPDLK